MGGKKGGGQSTPYEAANTLSSAQSLRIIDVIAEGVVSGFANGDDAPFKSVYFDDTPVQNPDGSFNFKGVVGFFQRGTPDQDYIPGFDTSERTVAVSARVRKDTPIVRTVSDSLISRLRITVGVERNAQTRDNGDTVAANTVMQVELVGASGVVAARTVAFTEKGSGAYYQDVVMDKLPPVPFNVRVSRISADSTSDRISNNTFFASYVEIVDAKLSYPHCAVAALAIDSDQFGSSVPRRNYLLKGRLLKVPSNYNPDARTYAPGAWDGGFKTAWSNNPAWVFYDIVTTPRYSTLARRLKVADIDKWSLYQIGRYCDEMVSDGYGGQEPRFVCNAYVANRRQAGEVLLDLASVFTGLPVWNGNQLSVVMDTNSDPVALYNNSNVKDGLFTYAGAAFKGIHTAVEVQYLDKYDGYRSKIEPVQDDVAIKRYGLNPKRVTAFGCDSRGQAVRVGAWLLQTELRQQNTISFTVGREGLRHLPYDVVTVMDNSYAGAELSGRVIDVSGSLITLDRDVGDAAGTLLYFVVDGAPQSVKVVAVAASNQLHVADGKGIEPGAAWVLSGKVKSRLYRAIGIKENTDEGTYTITALLHDPKKYAVVDGWASFDKDTTTLHTLQPELTGGSVAVENGAVVITWDNLTASGDVLSYDIKIYKDGKLYSHLPDAKSAEYRAENLPNGSYRVEIRGKNARGVMSEPLIQAFTLDYTLKNLRTKSKLFAIDLSWGVPEKVLRRAATEIWYAASRDLARAQKLDAVAWPQTGYTLNGVDVADRYWFWVRLVDADGLAGEFVGPAEGRADDDPAPIVAQITGAITESTLSRELIDQLDGKIAAGDSKTAADAAAALQKEAQARATALTAEAAARTAAINKEISDRVADVNAARNKAAGDLTAKAAELGTKITSVENVNNQQAQQINTVTAAQGVTAAGLETEKKARADGDAAEAAARTTLAARVTTAEGSITRNDGLRVTGDKANADAIAAMGVRVGSAESGITNLQQTVAGNQAATATDIKTLQASVGAGANLMQDSELKYGFTYLRANATSGDVTIGMNHAAYPVAGRNILFVRRAFVDTINRTMVLQRMAIQRGKIYQVAADCYQKGGAASGCKIYVRPVDATGAWNSTGVQVKNVGAAAVHDSRPFEYGHFVRSGENIRIDAASPVTHIDIAFSVRETTGTSVLIQLLTNPMICEVASIDAPLVPYSPGADPLIGVSEAGFNEYKQAQATADAAQTTELNAAKSSIAGNTAEIGTIKTTKADKNEVATLARTALQSEWRGYTDTAKAAAATDAQTKANTAQQAAINEAQRLNTATNASVTALQQTVSNNNTATATALENLNASLSSSAVDLVVPGADGTTRWQVMTSSSQDAAVVNGLLTIGRIDSAVTSGWTAAGTDVLPLMPGVVYKITYRLRQTWNPNGNARYYLGYAGLAADRKTMVNMSGANSIGSQHYFPGSGTALPLNEWVELSGYAVHPADADKVAMLPGARLAHENVRFISALLYLNYNNQPGKVELEWVKFEAVNSATLGVQAELNSYKQVQATIDAAQTSEINVAKSSIAGNTAKVTALETTVANNQSAMASRVSSVETQTGQNTASITSTSNAVTSLTGKVSALHTVKVEAISGGRKVVAGTALGVDGATGDSQFLVYADKFGMVNPSSKQIDTPFVINNTAGGAKMALKGDFVATGSILGSHIAANQTIQAPNILGGSLNIGGGRFTVNGAGQVSIAAQSGNVGLKVTNERIEVYDESGVLRVRLGKLV